MMEQHVARILVVEDNPSDIQLLRFALDTCGERYELEVLVDGAQALRFIHEHRTGMHEPNPCVIILDLHLPLHDGLAVLNAIRETPALAHIRVVVLTSLASPKQQAEIDLAGGIYRTKPTSLQDFGAFAAQILHLCKESATAAV